ncbi:ERI2 [Mytilus coruscus]|uniref:ERI2 n=1 Tax=Mytilus coruscus TaxID=42192 RepID=A0A6J8AET3_MYTCO|nr:ERI2 [Mytilus coruscus]
MKTTKQLARELGLLRKRSINSSTSKKPSTDQTFPYLVVLDFESTCWQDGKFRTQEIIEFPAVLLNTSTGKIESEFQFYVQPQEQPTLSEFCRQLTGITQTADWYNTGMSLLQPQEQPTLSEFCRQLTGITQVCHYCNHKNNQPSVNSDQVDNGIPLNLCVRKFVRWLDSLREKKGVVFTQPSTETDKCHLATIVTWSDWDLGVCLYNELRRKQIGRPCQLNSWIDLRATYRKFYSRKPNGLNGALKDLGIDFEGREHSGLHDSRNTAILAYRMIQDGCILNITKTLKGSNIPGGDKYLPIKQPTPNKHKIHQKKKPTPSKSPAHKRRKQSDIADDELCFDDDLDHAIASSQELDNIIINFAMETPEHKRKSRIPIASSCSSKILISEISPIQCSKSTKKSPSHQKLTKKKAKRIIPGKFNPSQIYVDPEVDTDAFVNGLKSTVNNRLTEVSVNVPLPKRVAPTKKNISPLKITEAYPQILFLSPLKQCHQKPQNSVNSIQMVRMGSPLKQSNQKSVGSFRKSNNTVRIAVQKFYSSPGKSAEENYSGSETALPQKKVQSCELTRIPYISPPKSETVITSRNGITSKSFPVFKTPSPPTESFKTPLIKASYSNTSKRNIKEVTITPSRTLPVYSDSLKTPVNTPGNCRNQSVPSGKTPNTTPSVSLSLSSFKTPSSILGTFKTPFGGQR